MAHRHVHTAALLADTADAERAFTAAYDGVRKALIAGPALEARPAGGLASRMRREEGQKEPQGQVEPDTRQ